MNKQWPASRRQRASFAAQPAQCACSGAGPLHCSMRGDSRRTFQEFLERQLEKSRKTRAESEIG